MPIFLLFSFFFIFPHFLILKFKDRQLEFNYFYTGREIKKKYERWHRVCKCKCKCEWRMAIDYSEFACTCCIQLDTVRGECEWCELLSDLLILSLLFLLLSDVSCKFFILSLASVSFSSFSTFLLLMLLEAYMSQPPAARKKLGEEKKLVCSHVSNTWPKLKKMKTLEDHRIPLQEGTGTQLFSLYLFFSFFLSCAGAKQIMASWSIAVKPAFFALFSLVATSDDTFTGMQFALYHKVGCPKEEM